jgi:hypothetical protein
MLVKTILVEVDVTTWPRSRPVPRQLLHGSGTHELDLKKALLMLGSLTMPNLFSVQLHKV